MVSTRKHRFNVTRDFLLVLCGVFSVFLPLNSQDLELRPSEYEIKAAFLYNFAKFIEWPDNSRQCQQDTAIIGILGEDPFGTILERVIGEKTIRMKEISIQRYSNVQNVRECHILFIGQSEKWRLSTILKQLSNRHILTVSEIDGFTEQGGMIGLFIENNRIRFQINQDAIEAAELKISSKLLKLASIIRHSDETVF
jgi:hypothetical protein